MTYTDLASFKNFRNIDSAGDDVVIANLIDAMDGYINEYTKRTFSGTAANRKFDAVSDVEGSVLWVFREGDLASISTITNGDGTTVTSSQYVTEPRNAVARGKPIIGIRLKTNSSIYWRTTSSGVSEDAITVNGVWAYSAAVPDTIKEAANLWVAHLYDRRMSDDGDLVIVPGTSVQISRGIPAVVRALLEPYIRVIA